MDTEIAFGFVGLFNRFGDILDGRCKAFERGIDAFEARGNSFEKFYLRVVF